MPNEALFPATSIQAVFSSGNADEVIADAEIVAALPGMDLAMLRVSGIKHLPKPVTLAADIELMETASIYSFGFPFGQLLSLSDGNPAVTVAKGSLSSLRRNKAGELVAIQIDGALNPGNSGGPVTDREGRVIGVARAAIKGAQIGFAIPAAEVLKLINGVIADSKVHVVRLGAAAPELHVEVTLADPLLRLRSIGFRYLARMPSKQNPHRAKRRRSKAPPRWN